MKLKRATWDEAIFGCEVYEAELRDPKDVEPFLSEMDSSRYHHAYIIAKTLTGAPWMVHDLEERGFRFLETQITYKGLYTNPYLADKIETLKQVDGRSLSGKEELELLLEEIEKGIFTTDRVSLDPFLGSEKANRRFVNWVRQESDQSELHWVSIDNRRIGFSLYQIRNQTSLSILAGKFSGYNEMLGAFVLGYPIVKGMESHCKKFVCSVSTNNLPAIRFYQKLGFQITDLTCVLRRLPDYRANRK